MNGTAFSTAGQRAIGNGNGNDNGNGTGTHITIDQISISGVDAATARAIGPAIERALSNAAHDLSPATLRHLSIDLAHGADERTIAAAVVRALRCSS